MNEQLAQALQAIPDQFRVAVILRDMQNLSYEEIAIQTRCSVGTVRSRIHQGRELHRESMKSHLAKKNKGMGIGKTDYNY